MILQEAFICICHNNDASPLNKSLLYILNKRLLLFSKPINAQTNNVAIL